jgi:hypothetical protein
MSGLERGSYQNAPDVRHLPATTAVTHLITRISFETTSSESSAAKYELVVGLERRGVMQQPTGMAAMHIRSACC